MWAPARLRPDRTLVSRSSAHGRHNGSSFSLIIPSLEASHDFYGAGVLPAAIAVGGILIGACTLAVLNEVLPHQHFVQGRECPASASLRRVWLFVFARSRFTISRKGWRWRWALAAATWPTASRWHRHRPAERPGGFGRSGGVAGRGLLALARICDCVADRTGRAHRRCARVGGGDHRRARVAMLYGDQPRDHSGDPQARLPKTCCF
jgi:hypothetical protein